MKAIEKGLSKKFELWECVFKFLSLQGSKINRDFCKDEITTHPDYPALTSVIDFLDNGGLLYKAVQTDKTYIDRLNYPLLAHIRKPGQEYLHLIADANIWEKEKEIIHNWTGIVVFPEKNTKWQNEQNDIYVRNSIKNKIIGFILGFIGFALFLISVFQFPSILINLFGLFSILGLIVSLFLLGTELGFQSQLVKQVCGAVNSGGCEKVLKSSYAKGAAGITPSDASVLYFAAQFIVYLLGCWYPTFFVFIFLLSFGCFLIGMWSIYTQAVKLKQWCALCLGIVAVLVLQSILAMFILQTSFSNHLYISIYLGFGIYSALFFVMFLAFLPIKQIIKTNKSNKLKLSELKKWKLDAGLFLNQWQQEIEVDTLIWENDLVIGNPTAPLLFTVACNPYCGPCAKAHKQIENILHRFPKNLKVQIRLLCNDADENDNRTIAVKAILQKAEIIKNDHELLQMLNDWFELMDYEKWVDIWQPDYTINIKTKLHRHNKWVADSSITFTPTFFLNGRKIPGRYNLDDIGILIPQLTEMLNKDIERTI